MAPRRSPPKGVVLLLVLSLLVLFVLLAMTFLIGAMRYRSGAEAFGQRELLGDAPDKLADLAVHQLIRDSANPYSSLYGQSLLLDLYGADSTAGEIIDAYTSANKNPNDTPPNTDPATAEVLRFDVQMASANLLNTSPHIDHYAGCVFTIISGPAARQSGRVVRYVPAQFNAAGNVTQATFYVEGFETNSETIRSYIADPDNDAVQFLVNGKPFNGAGVGYSLRNGGNGDPNLSLVALSPHYGHYLAREHNAVPSPQGEADEPYDALDYQNMYLAKNPPQPDPAGAQVPVVASFHRPELIRYAANPDTASAWSSFLNWNWASGDNYRTFRRRFIFRPMPWDHPDFTGSNPAFEAPTVNGYVSWSTGADGEPGTMGVDDDGDGNVDNLNVDTDNDGVNDYSTELGWPGSDDVLTNDDVLVQNLIAAGTTSANTLYDVDNDGDGIKDSFWMDLQLPAKTAANGRLYKPLVAFLIVDQDGRLNVNAAGSLAQTQAGYHTGDQTATGQRAYAGPYTDTTAMMPVTQYGSLSVLERRDNNGNNTQFDLNDWPAHGQGYGPAGISFQHLVTDNNNVNDRSDVARYEAIMLSRYASRYDGADIMPGSAGADFLAFLKSVGRPDYFATAPSMGNPNPYGSWTNPSAYFSPPDVFDRGTVALSPAGQPIWRYAGTPGTIVTSAGSAAASERENHPYEMNLVQPNADDSPFTPGELEQLLRYRDADAGILADRLVALLNTPTADTSLAQLSKLLTTHSSYIPSPLTVPLPPDNGITDWQLFDILFPTDLVLPLPTMGSPQPNPMQNNAARIAIRTVNPNTGNVDSMTGVARMPTIIDLMAAKIVQGHVVSATSNMGTSVPNMLNGIPNTPAGRSQLQLHLSMVVPFEFLRGQKMDPNRLWGNGEDDNGNDMVDEQAFAGWEVDSENIWPGSSAAGSAEYRNDDPLASLAFHHPRGREIFARHLYCLMMLLVDLEYVPAVGGAFGNPQTPGYMEPYTDNPTTPMFTGANAEVMRRELTVRRIAQWAINVVDFRDSDAIMTPFEYDVNPWNFNEVNPARCWSLDGRIDTDDLGMNQGDGLAPTIPPPAEAHPERRVVWGCEHPDLLITETMALHDRRAKDTEYDNGDMSKRDATANTDNDLDQFRLPQGSLFIELYCPKRNVYSNGSVNDYQVAPQELYTIDSNSARLRLAQLAPAAGMGPQYPVWRMAISETHRNVAAAGPLELIAARRHDNATFQPYSDDQPDEMNIVTTPQIPRLNIDRIVWFTTQAPPASMAFEQDRVYYNRYGATELPAGEYLVVGPRAITHVGSRDDAGDLMTTIDMPSEQEFRLVNPTNAASVFHYTDFGYPRRYPTDTTTLGSGPAAAQVKRARTIIAAAHPPTNWDQTPTSLEETCNLLAGVTLPPGVTPPTGVGLSVTEPLPDANYYPEPPMFLEGDMPSVEYPLRDSWRDGINGAGELPDQPFDTDPGPPANTRSIRDDNLSRTGRYGAVNENNHGYKTVFLQRLANPLLPWHATINPYVTVDWHPIDLTVFNGEDRERGTEPPGGQWDPSDDNPNNSNPRAPDDNPQFASHERVGQQRSTTNNVPPGTVNYGLWRTHYLAHEEAEPDPRPDDYFKLNARHSLGYLSRLIDGTANAGHPNPASGMGADDDDFLTAPAHASVVGDPTLPFPWLAWNDRPYVSHLELMFVPASSQGRLLFEFTHHVQTNSANNDPYAPHNLATPPSSVDPNAAPFSYNSSRSPYGHLLNFFHTTGKTAAFGSTTRGANYYRLLDFVEVPSRFAGTEKWFNPDEIRNANANANDVIHYRPPFNYLSRFRDPGRVNLNTIWDFRVWRGVSSGFPLLASSSTWDSIHNTMRAGAAVSTPAAADYPTYYPNPLRPAGSAAFAPPLAPGATDSDTLRLREDAVDVTLLRSSNTAAPPGALRQPLLDHPNFTYNNPPTEDIAAHPQPNAYFRYQGLQRLGNLVSGQSNVFAVWVTIGYFEVTHSPAGVDREHPDGLLLGQELGSETGEIVRHRAFYMIDRSIPVGFQPGVNHNVEKTILLRRFIE